MKSSTKCTVVTVILMVICLGIGMVAGVYLGYRSGTSTVATISINTQVHDLENRVEALQAHSTAYIEDPVVVNKIFSRLNSNLTIPLQLQREP